MMIQFAFSTAPLVVICVAAGALILGLAYIAYRVAKDL